MSAAFIDEPRSVLVFGSGESAMSMLAAGLVARVRPRFAWANCSGTTVTWERWVAETIEHGAAGRRTDRVDPRDLRLSERPADAVGRLVLADTLPDEMRSRLVDFVRLPVLFQRLISQFDALEPSVSLVLTNADALRTPLAESALANAHLHAALHRERISLSVTFRGEPPSTIKEAFDQVLRVDSPKDGRWTDARVMSERGLEESELLLPQSMRSAWTILRLNPLWLPTNLSD
jgi:hypothetical protein